MNDRIETYKPGGDGDSSGFTAPLQRDEGGIFDTRFVDIRVVYSSSSGYSRLLSAKRFGKRYLLKTLKPEYAANPLYHTLLAKEFSIAVDLDHPNIRQTIGYEDVDDYGNCIVLEYVDGLTLRRLMDAGQVSETNCRAIIRQLASALKYLHAKEILHRDLKPENIMVTHVGETVKLIDFSLADSDNYMVVKTQAGTRSYMAPELIKPGVPASIVTDIYSYGLIISELCSFVDDAKLERFARRCTAANPARRLQSLANIDLNRIMADRTKASRTFGLESRGLTWLLLVIVILLTIILSLMI